MLGGYGLAFGVLSLFLVSFFHFIFIYLSASSGLQHQHECELHDFIFLGTEYLISNPIDLGNATRTISTTTTTSMGIYCTEYNCRI